MCGIKASEAQWRGSILRVCQAQKYNTCMESYRRSSLIADFRGKEKTVISKIRDKRGMFKIACLWRFWDFRDTFPKTPGYVLWWKTNLKQVLQPVPWVSETNFWWSKARFIKITQKAEIFIFCHCLHGMARKAIRNDTGNKIKLIWGARVEKLWKVCF